MLKCGWCGMAGRSVGTTSEYECGSSIGCAHQRQSPACKEIERLRKALTGIRDALEQIVVSEDQDAGGDDSLMGTAYCVGRATNGRGTNGSAGVLASGPSGGYAFFGGAK